MFVNNIGFQLPSAPCLEPHKHQLRCSQATCLPFPPAQDWGHVIIPPLRVHKLHMCTQEEYVGRCASEGHLSQALGGLGQGQSVQIPGQTEEGWGFGHLAPALGGPISGGCGLTPGQDPTQGPSVLTPETQDPQALWT